MASVAARERGSHDATRSRPAWQVWRSPAGQPRWARPVVLAVVALAGTLYAWNLDRAGYQPFYAVAVHGMATSWRAALYGAFDPASTVTIDKLPGAFVPQVLSVLAFGFHPWAMALPQAVEGVVAALVMYRLVRRWTGAVAGVLACGIFAFTPVLAVMYGRTMEDAALTTCLVLAADRYQVAVRSGRLRPLVFAGVWVGVGFQAKMLEAWLVLPALAVGYLVTVSGDRRRRLTHLAVAGAVTVAVSLSWVSLYSFTPARDRPYLDGTTDNDAWTMVFGYNGLARFGIPVPGSVHAVIVSPAASRPTGLAALRVVPDTLFGYPEHQGALKLAEPAMGTQVGWLFPAALLTLALVLWWWRHTRRDDGRWGGAVMWGVWLGTAALVLSVMQLPHTAYLSILAPAVAALAGTGIALAWHACRAGLPRWWLLPVMVAAETVWSCYLGWPRHGFLPWLAPAVALLGASALVLVRLAWRGSRRLAVAAVPAGLVAMLLAPAAWASSTVDPRYRGSPAEALAGPMTAHNTITADYRALTAGQRRLLSYVGTHGPGTRFAFATDSWLTAAPYLTAGNATVLPMGGYSGEVPAPGLARVRGLVRTGELRYFLLGGSHPGWPDHPRGAALTAVGRWVTGTCTRVRDAPPTGRLVLYRC